jgi:hypothetical protein
MKIGAAVRQSLCCLTLLLCFIPTLCSGQQAPVLS